MDVYIAYVISFAMMDNSSSNYSLEMEIKRNYRFINS